MSEWRDLAACRGKPVEWWVPADGAVGGTQRHAIAICKSCPVQLACLRELHDDPFAIVGGLLPRQRRARSRKQLAYLPMHTEPEDRTPHGTDAGYRHWGCRCQECRQAAAVYRRKWRETNPASYYASQRRRYQRRKAKATQ